MTGNETFVASPSGAGVDRDKAGKGAALEMRGISKTFGPVKALTNVSLTAYPGEIHALMGENGAGKSTLMKILSGAYHADPGGEIRIDGKPLQIGSPQAGRRSGIAVIYQELALAPNLTVAENMFLGEEKRRNGMIDRAAMNAAAQPYLDRLAAPFSPAAKVVSLSIAERQLVEIARALAGHPHILVMDEPTTCLSAREADKLFTIIRTLKSEGIAIIYISHRMGEVYELSDRVSVLRDGAMVGTLMRSELSAQTLVRMMVGRDQSSFYTKAHRAPEVDRKIALDVRNIDDGNRVHDCSFSVAEGEVLGIAGLVGSGRTELARLVYGADPKTHGQVFVGGTERQITNPRQAIDAGIVYLTEDRKILGLFLDMSISGNVNINVLDEDARPGACSTWPRLGGGHRPPSRSSASALRMPRSTSAASPAATSRRCCCPVCWKASRGFSSSMSRRAASMWAQNPKSTGSSTIWPGRGRPSSSSPASCRRWSACRTVSWSCATGAWSAR